jgi:hypothetical protein
LYRKKSLKASYSLQRGKPMSESLSQLTYKDIKVEVFYPIKTITKIQVHKTLNEHVVAVSYEVESKNFYNIGDKVTYKQVEFDIASQSSITFIANTIA